jgi:lantibiotic biosynthesis protein
MSGHGQGDFLQAAHRIARDLLNEAIFAGDRCNWVGAAIREGPGGSVTIDHRALDATVYEGTSGVGLFLAETAHVTGDVELATTATSAVRQSLDRAEGNGSPYLSGVLQAAMPRPGWTCSHGQRRKARAAR